MNLISRHNSNTDMKDWIQSGLLPLSTSRPKWWTDPPLDARIRWYSFSVVLTGKNRETYQHLWHKTPPSHPLSVYVFLSPTISSLPSFVPSCQCCAKEPSPFSLTHLSCPFMMVSPFLFLSLSLFLSSSSLLDFLHPHHLWVPLSSPPPLSIPPLLALTPPPPHAGVRARTCTLGRERGFEY